MPFAYDSVSFKKLDLLYAAALLTKTFLPTYIRGATNSITSGRRVELVSCYGS